MITDTDLAICGNPAFPAAYEKLTEMVDVKYREMLIDALWMYRAALEVESPHNPLEVIPPLMQVVFAITIMNLTLGTPLFLNDMVLYLWSTVQDDKFAECECCGYMAPPMLSECPACKGKTGESGVWARNRARLAVLN